MGFATLQSPTFMADFLCQSGGYAVIDGGLATELERHGADLNDPLWSATCLIHSPDLIRRVIHSLFLFLSVSSFFFFSSFRCLFFGFGFIFHFYEFYGLKFDLSVSLGEAHVLFRLSALFLSFLLVES